MHNIGAIHHFASKSNGWILTDGTSSLAKKIGLATRQYQNIPQNKAKVIALVNSKGNSPSSIAQSLESGWTSRGLPPTGLPTQKLILPTKKLILPTE